MSFRKRNLGISSDTVQVSGSKESAREVAHPLPLPGVKPSPIDGRLITSTGTATLDGLLAGHSGLPLGTSLLVEENGTTDYAGALLRFYAAEGLVQGHHIYVIGMPEQWGRDLPGLAGKGEKNAKSEKAEDKMKIAWRYESLGRFGEATGTRDRPFQTTPSLDSSSQTQAQFCHTFDLMRRLPHPVDSQIKFLQLNLDHDRSPFDGVLTQLRSLLAVSSPSTVHRCVIPSILSPALYPPHSSQPEYVLSFLHDLRALLAAYHGRLTAMMSLPLALFSRSSGLVRWIEILSDGAIELAPFPHSAEVDDGPKKGQEAFEEEPQGLLRIHRLPIFHDRYSGTASIADDWTFALSRRNFTIKPYSLPPIEGDSEAQQAAKEESKGNKADIEF